MSYRNITAPQIRAARGLLDWNQTDLAAASGVALSTVKRMESLGPDKSSVQNVDKISTALEKAGVAFTNDGEPGVKLTRR